MEHYKQCELRHGIFTTVAWIAERGAKIGLCVTLKDSDNPEQFWEVIGVSSTRIPVDEARAHAREAHTFKERGSIGTALK